MCNEWRWRGGWWGGAKVELNQGGKREKKITELRNILITDKWRFRPIAVLDLKI